jgi:uncharacterized RDD family membrane protein YckC
VSATGESRYLQRSESGTRREVVTPEGVPLGLTLGKAGDRASAFLLDATFIAAAGFLILILIGFAGGRDIERGWAMPFVMLITFFLRNFYFMFFELRWQGSTPGKRLIGIRVIDGHGGPLSADAVIARNLVRDIEVFLPLQIVLAPEQLWPDAAGWARLLSSAWLFIFVFMPLFNKDRLRIGDMVAGTLVVLQPKALLLSDIGGQEVSRAAHQEHSYTFTEKQLDIYGIYELQVLEDVLRGGDDEMHRLEAIATVCEKIKSKIGWEQSSWQVEPERFLREFYAALRARLEKKLLFGKRREDKYSSTK